MVVPHASECSVTERMQGQLVLALCTSLILVSGALEHRLHARETDGASGGGKNTHTLAISSYVLTVFRYNNSYAATIATNRSAKG